MAIGPTAAGLHLIGAGEVKRHWGWFLALGIALVVLGIIAVGAAVVTTMVSVLLFGWLLIIGGVLSVFHAFWHERGWGGFFINLLTGVLYLAVGAMLIANPVEGALALTLLMALFFIVEGVFRIGVALAVRFQHWGWLLLNGVVTLLLGVFIWAQWPVAGLWVIGLFIGIDLIFNGWALVMLSMAVRSIPEEGTHPAAAGA